MTYTAEQLIAAQKSNVETLAGLTSQFFSGLEKLFELNVVTTKAAVSGAFDHTQAVLSVRDAQELLALQAGLFQPAMEKSAAYNRHVYDIASDTGAEFTKVFEAKLAEAQKAFSTEVDGALKNAPAGSDTAVALFKSAFSASQSAIESAQAAAKQAMELAGTNFNAVASQAAAGAKKR
jgi:phasin family protein